MADAILASELGMGLPLFTICPMIALYFGSASQDKSAMKKAATQYFRSPMFIAVLLGLAASPFSLDPQDPFVAPFIIALNMISGAVALLATLVLGPVFATRYQCDGETASALAFINILLSVILIPLVFSVLIT